jgi:hypothetical protein
VLSRLWHLLFSASPALFGSWLSSIPAESIVTTLAAKQQWAALVYVLSLYCPIGLIADFSHNVARLRRPGGGSVRGAAYAALAKSALFAFGLIWIHGQIFSAVGLCDGAPCREDPSFFEDNRRLGEHWHVVHDHWIAMYYAIITWTTTGYGDFVPPPSLRLFAAGEALIGVFVIAFQIGMITAVIASELGDPPRPPINAGG